MTGELKEIWSSVQNFRDKEKAGMSDIVVYTDFGPDPLTIQANDRDESNCKDPEKAIDAEADANLNTANDSIVERAVFNEKNYECDDDNVESAGVEKLSIGDKKSGKKDEEIVKLQNQKNKSQSNFFPKFLSSSKDNSPKATKDTKKSLNFFRRNKSSSSPTHTPNNNPTSNLN